MDKIISTALQQVLQIQIQSSSIFKYIFIHIKEFVFDNSTTGNICNDLLKFVPGTLQQTNQHLTTVQEGTIKIHIANDDGKVHSFFWKDASII